ncbi:MAG: metallophosphoesterase [Candidatus Riflemargulisbacteria bacterium]
MVFLRSVAVFFGLLIVLTVFISCGTVVRLTDDSVNQTIYGPVSGVDSIVIYGDTRTQHDIHQKIINNILWQKPIAAFHVGDLVADGNSVSDWATYDSITASLNANIPFYPVPGNHEFNSSLYYSHFGLPYDVPWYSVTTRNIHFVMLDSNTVHPLDPGSIQYEWLSADLKAMSVSIDYVFAVFHHPLLTDGSHPSDETLISANIMPLFRQYGVQAIFAGHNHMYERFWSEGIHFITTGGGGAPLHARQRYSSSNVVCQSTYEYTVLRIYSDKIAVDVLDLNNERIDQFDIYPR